MIIPLNLSFSSNYRSLRTLLLNGYDYNWFSSYGRIPASLFSADVRVRNTIHLGAKAADEQEHAQFTTVLHRWFDAYRPHLMATLSYAAFDPAAFNGLIPKINTAALSEAMTALAKRVRHTVGDVFSSKQTAHGIHFKKTAYNWLAFCKTLPPCFDSGGRPIVHTKFGEVWLADSKMRDILLTLLNGKLLYAYWCMIGDDFDVTRWMFEEFPFDSTILSDSQTRRLVQLSAALEKCMAANTSFKLNAGKRVGNYNLARCRSVTDSSDAIFAEVLGLSAVWQDIELMYSQVVKTGFEEE